LGYELKMSMEEVLLMTDEEFTYWIAYFKVKADKEKTYGRATTENSPRRNR